MPTLDTIGPDARVRNPQAIAKLLLGRGVILAIRSNLARVMLRLVLVYTEGFAILLEHRWMLRQFGADHETHVRSVLR